MPDIQIEIAECSECGEPIRRLYKVMWDHVPADLSGVDYVNWYRLVSQRPCWMKAKPKDGKPSPESLLAQALEERDQVVALLVEMYSASRCTLLKDGQSCGQCEGAIKQCADFLAKIGAKP